MIRFFDNLKTKLSTDLDLFFFKTKLEDMAKDGSLARTPPNEIFSGISDEFWYWLYTTGYRTIPALRSVLPDMPDEDVQLQFTGNKGDVVLREGYLAYTLFKELYIQHGGLLSECNSILDFGCGWGRIIRFFLKDLAPSKIWGCDPVEKMIDICKEQNRWCNFKATTPRPPSPFANNTFDFIYSFSVFSHLSEEMSDNLITELARILRPGGILIVTTRSRDFIEFCATMRAREDLNTLHAGPKSSSDAFYNTKETLADYDSGRYCFSQLIHEGEWSYWGEAAISKKYVLAHWTKSLEFVAYVDDHNHISQNAIVMRKPVRPTKSINLLASL